jgi:hypothetical protein
MPATFPKMPLHPIAKSSATAIVAPTAIVKWMNLWRGRFMECATPPYVL